MIIYLIFKQIMDSQGINIKTELVECDINEQNANRFSKLYNLQVPTDLKKKIQYTYVGARVL